MLNNRTFKLAHILAAAVFLILSCLAGCKPAASETKDAQTSQITSETAAGTTSTAPDISARPDAASGTLRIWWNKRQTLNPLLDATRTGQAVSRLLYQSLYRVDASQRCVAQISSGIEVWMGGLLAIVTIRPGLQFSDGTPLTAADVADCISFIQAHPAESPYSAALTVVSKAEASGSGMLELTLSKPDPWLPFALTFPVIPSECLDAGPADLIPGSGDFVMQSYSAEEGLILAKAAAPEYPNELTTIRVIEYNNLTAAMQGFENDEVDLVYMDAENYNRYQLRGSLRFDPFPCGRMLMIAFNTANRKPLSNLDRLLFLKKVLEPAQVAASAMTPWGGQSVDVPLPAASWILGGEEASSSGVLDSLGDPSWDKKTRQLVLLAPQGDPLYADMAGAIGRCLDKAGVKWRLAALAEAEYLAELQQGDYDMVLLETQLPDCPDPSWLYRDDRPAAGAVLDALSKYGLDGYGDWRQKLAVLMATGPDDKARAGRDAADALAQTAARSPYGILLLRSDALLYGDRVTGQCRPSGNDPYEGIEELWVWSG